MRSQRPTHKEHATVELQPIPPLQVLKCPTLDQSTEVEDERVGVEAGLDERGHRESCAGRQESVVVDREGTGFNPGLDVLQLLESLVEELEEQLLGNTVRLHDHDELAVQEGRLVMGGLIVSFYPRAAGAHSNNVQRLLVAVELDLRLAQEHLIGLSKLRPAGKHALGTTTVSFSSR